MRADRQTKQTETIIAIIHIPTAGKSNN